MSLPHTHAGRTVAVSRRVTVPLAVVLAVMFIATVVAAILLWPKPGELPTKQPITYPGTDQTSVTVVAIDDPGNSSEGRNARILVRIPETGERAIVEISPLIVYDDMVGATMRVATPSLELSAAAGNPRPYFFIDFDRSWPLLLLGGIFAAVVIAVARIKGLAALAGLIGALAMVWFFTLPALLAGKPPLAVALVTASAVLFIVVYLAHGISVKSSTALLGTFAGIALVTALASWAIPASHLIPGVSEEMVQLATFGPKATLRGVLLCGMVLTSVGVLNDVTITQASAVWELRAAAPEHPRRRLFSHALRIGQDHIASTVYTIAFAYVGGSIGLLLLASTLDHRILDLVQYNEVAQELVGIIVTSVGLVLTIPLTTAIAAALAGPRSAGTTAVAAVPAT